MQHREEIWFLRRFIYSAELFFCRSYSVNLCVKQKCFYRRKNRKGKNMENNSLEASSSSRMKRTLFRFLSFAPDDAQHRSESENAINIFVFFSIFSMLRIGKSARGGTTRGRKGCRMLVLTCFFVRCCWGCGRVEIKVKGIKYSISRKKGKKIYRKNMQTRLWWIL